MTWADHSTALVVLAFTLYAMADGKRFQEKLRTIDTVPNGRIKLYWSNMLWLWGVVAAVIALCLYQDYRFESLGLRTPSTWRFWSVALAVFLIAAFYASYIRQLRRDDGLKQKTRESLESTRTEALIPRNRTELRLWVLVSLSSGLEELVYRGFLLWYLMAYTNIVVAGAISTMLFAVGHNYQGIGGLIKTSVFGGVLVAVYWLADSLWPAIALHAAQDLVGGAAGYLSYASNGSDAKDNFHDPASTA